MTVAELIAQLQTYPPEMRVLVEKDQYENVVVETHVYADKEIERELGALTDCVGCYIGSPTP